MNPQENKKEKKVRLPLWIIAGLVLAYGFILVMGLLDRNGMMTLDVRIILVIAVILLVIIWGMGIYRFLSIKKQKA